MQQQHFPSCGTAWIWAILCFTEPTFLAQTAFGLAIFPPRTLTVSPSMGNSATTVCVTADTECCAGTENRIACVNMMASLPWQTECFLFCGKQRGNGEGRVILSQGSDTNGAGSRTDHMTWNPFCWTHSWLHHFGLNQRSNPSAPALMGTRSARNKD